MGTETRTERVLALAKKIEAGRQEVQRTKAATADAEARLAALVAELETLMGSRKAQTEELGQAQMSRASQIIGILEGSDATWSISQLAGELQVDNIASLRATLNRLADAGRIQRAGRGEFRASPGEFVPPGR